MAAPTRCPNGHENPQGQRFCGECGASLGAVPGAAGQNAPPVSSQPQRVPPPPPPRAQPEPGVKGGRKRPFYRRPAFLAVALVVAVVVVASIGQTSRDGQGHPVAASPTSAYGSASPPPSPETSIEPSGKMPRVVGLDEQAAGDLVGQQLVGLQVVVTEKESTKPRGTVLSQDPPAGSVLHSSDIVHLYVAVPPEAPGFDDGVWVVGKDIRPGTYRDADPGNACYWERLKGFTGNFNEIIANDNASGPTVVTIEPTDKGFRSEDCGHWTSDLSAITSSRTSFSDGIWIVGVDIVPGTYRAADPSHSCYWERLRGFTGEFNDIITNDNVNAPTIVQILSTDEGFRSDGCGTWHKV